MPASLVGVEGATLNGMAFTLVGGHAWWDRAGVRHNSWRGTKYYRFNGQVFAMRKNGVLTYLHGDHLGSTVLTTNSSGNFNGQDLRQAYGRQRGGTELGTENRFTGQKLDGAGLMYFNARYYDPELGQFISPDTLVPDPTHLFDYNRYMYVRGNAMNATDPTGHCYFAATAGGRGAMSIGCGGGGAIGLALSVGLAAQQGLQVVAPHTDKVVAVADGVVRMSEQAAHHAGQQNAGDNSGNTADPGGLDPNEFNKTTQVTEKLGQLRSIGQNLWESTAGLRYGTDPSPQFGNRVQHVLAHTSDDLSKTLHGVFNTGRSGTLELIDEGWQLIQKNGIQGAVQGSRIVYSS